MADNKHFRLDLKQTAGKSKIDTLLADAGYDSESSYEHAHG